MNSNGASILQSCLGLLNPIKICMGYWRLIQGESCFVYSLPPSLPLLTLIIESINSVNTGTLVVASQQEEILRVFDFVGQ